MSSYDLQTRRDGPAAEFLKGQNGVGALPDRKKCEKVNEKVGMTTVVDEKSVASAVRPHWPGISRLIHACFAGLAVHA